MRSLRRRSGLFPVPGLLVMAASGWWARRHTPLWYDQGETCLVRSPCFTPEESASALQALSWASWAGLVLVLVGTALTARGLAPAPQRTNVPRPVVHALAAGLVASAVVSAGAAAALFGALAVSTQLAWSVVVGVWLGLARCLETLIASVGRPCGPRAAYLLGLVVATAAVPAAVLPLALGAEVESWGWGILSTGLAAAALTALSDLVPGRLLPTAAGVGATAALLGVVVPTAAMAAMGLLADPEPAASWTAPTTTEPPVPRPSATGAPTPGTRPTTSAPGRSTGVATRRACVPSDLALSLGGFDATMGARVATLTAANTSGSACYLDGFATVALEQGGESVDVTVGRTSSERPGAAGRATRVGLGAGHRGRLELYWRGYGAAADQSTPQVLTVTLRSGAPPVRLPVRAPLFDLIDGGELAVGNWLPAD